VELRSGTTYKGGNSSWKGGNSSLVKESSCKLLVWWCRFLKYHISKEVNNNNNNNNKNNNKKMTRFHGGSKLLSFWRRNDFVQFYFYWSKCKLCTNVNKHICFKIPLSACSCVHCRCFWCYHLLLFFPLFENVCPVRLDAVRVYLCMFGSACLNFSTLCIQGQFFFLIKAVIRIIYNKLIN